MRFDSTGYVIASMLLRAVETKALPVIELRDDTKFCLSTRAALRTYAKTVDEEPKFLAEDKYETPSDEWMPLNEAARKLFELTEGEMIGHIAAVKQTPDETLDFYGVHVTQTNVTRLYGKRPPSTKRRLIDPDEVKNLHIAEGATVLEDMYDTNHRYIDLEIKKSDFDALAREITDITR